MSSKGNLKNKEQYFVSFSYVAGAKGEGQICFSDTKCEISIEDILSNGLVESVRKQIETKERVRGNMAHKFNILNIIPAYTLLPLSNELKAKESETENNDVEAILEEVISIIDKRIEVVERSAVYYNETPGKGLVSVYWTMCINELRQAKRMIERLHK